MKHINGETEKKELLGLFSSKEGMNVRELAKAIGKGYDMAWLKVDELKKENLLKKIGYRQKGAVYQAIKLEKTVTQTVLKPILKESPKGEDKEVVSSETTTDLGEFQAKVSIIKPPATKPVHYDVDDNLPLIERLLEHGKSAVLLLRGAPGTGKTNLIRYLQWKYNKDVVRVNVTVDTEAQELKGKYVIERDGSGKVITKWVDGLITTALRTGAWLQLEEVNFMRREHQSIFYSLFDERREIILEQKGGERVTNDNLVAFLTMNPFGWLKPIIPALKSRVDAIFEFKYLSVAKQRDILMEKYGCPEKLAEQIARTIDLIRRDKKFEKVAISSREAEGWVKLCKENGGWEKDKKMILRAFNHSVALKVTDDEETRGGLISVAEAIIEGKVGYVRSPSSDE